MLNLNVVKGKISTLDGSEEDGMKMGLPRYYITIIDADIRCDHFLLIVSSSKFFGLRNYFLTTNNVYYLNLIDSLG